MLLIKKLHINGLLDNGNIDDITCTKYLVIIYCILKDLYNIFFN